MKINQKVKSILAIIAATVAFSTQFVQYYVDEFIFSLIEDTWLNGIVALFSKWLLTYGLLLIIGRIYYGRDKRLLRFPLAFAFGSDVGVAAYSLLEVIFTDLLYDRVYVDSSYILIASSLAGIIVGAAALLLFMKKESLCFGASDETEDCVTAKRNRAVYGEKSSAVIITLSLGISFLFLRLSVIFGYNIVADFVFGSDSVLGESLPFNLLDLVIGIAVLLVCFLLGRSFSGNNIAAFYLVSLFCFAEYISNLISEIVRTPVMTPIADFVSGFYGIPGALLSFIPTYIGDIVAVLTAVLICRILTGSKEKKTNGLS